MLAVMNLHRLGINVRLQRIIRVSKRSQGEGARRICRAHGGDKVGTNADGGSEEGGIFQGVTTCNHKIG